MPLCMCAQQFCIRVVKVLYSDMHFSDSRLPYHKQGRGSTFTDHLMKQTFNYSSCKKFQKRRNHSSWWMYKKVVLFHTKSFHILCNINILMVPMFFSYYKLYFFCHDSTVCVVCVCYIQYSHITISLTKKDYVALLSSKFWFIIRPMQHKY